MNKIGAVVVKVLTNPYQNEYEDWVVEVESMDMGGIQKEELKFNSKEKASEIDAGYQFMH